MYNAGSVLLVSNCLKMQLIQHFRFSTKWIQSSTISPLNLVKLDWIGRFCPCGLDSKNTLITHCLVFSFVDSRKLKPVNLHIIHSKKLKWRDPTSLLKFELLCMELPSYLSKKNKNTNQTSTYFEMGLRLGSGIHFA